MTHEYQEKRRELARLHQRAIEDFDDLCNHLDWLETLGVNQGKYHEVIGKITEAAARCMELSQERLTTYREHFG